MKRDYQSVRNKAREKLKRSGQRLVFKTFDYRETGFNKYGDEVAGSDPQVSISGYGVKLEYNVRDSSATVYNADSRNVVAGDCKLLFVDDENSSKIETGMRVSINGETWRVVNPGAFEPSESVVYYEVHLRK